MAMKLVSDSEHVVVAQTPSSPCTPQHTQLLSSPPPTPPHNVTLLTPTKKSPSRVAQALQTIGTTKRKSRNEAYDAHSRFMRSLNSQQGKRRRQPTQRMEKVD